VKRILFILSIILYAGTVNGQDPQFSQYYASPLYLNPGFTGATQSHRLVLNHRIQWPNLPQAFATYAFSYDYFLPDMKSGFGLLFTTDKAGEASLRSTSIGLLYSYKIQTPSNWIFSPGLYFGYVNRDLDFSKLLFGDQVDFDQSGAPTLDPVANNIEASNYFDFGSGILAYNEKYWLGVSFYHINTPNNSLLEGESPVPVKMQIHGGARFPLKTEMINRGEKVPSITPSFVFRSQGEFRQLDFGLHYHIEPIMIGAWYRGIPVTKNVEGRTSSDAIVFIMGLQFSRFELGYSYDFTVSKLSGESGGAHEISLIYQFETFASKKVVKRKQKFIPCPSFNRKSFWKN